MTVAGFFWSLWSWMVWIAMWGAFWTGLVRASLYVINLLVESIAFVFSKRPAAPTVSEEARQRKHVVVYKGLKRVDEILDELKRIAFETRGGVLKRHVLPIGENAGEKDITRARSLCDLLVHHIDEWKAQNQITDEDYAEYEFLIEAKHEKIRDTLELIAKRRRTWCEFLQWVLVKVSNAGTHMIGHAGTKLLLGYG